MSKVHFRQFISTAICLFSLPALSVLPVFAQQRNSQNSDPTAPTNSPSGQTTVSDQTFATQAAQSDMTEILTSRLALERSRTEAVRNYAESMIRQHTLSSRQLMGIAQRKGLQLPQDIGPDNQAMLEQLQALRGTEFDQAYMTGQIMAHNKALALYQQYQQQGQDSELRTFASQVSPIVSQHLTMAQSMVAKR